MKTTPQDRPLSALREETVDRLIISYGKGHLSLEAFERRLDRALEATTHEVLLALTSDLEEASTPDQAEREFLERKRGALGVKSEPASDDRREHIVNILGGTKRSGSWSVPSEIRIFTLLGGATLDFSDARFTSQTTRVRAFSLLGGLTIYVPENVNTVSKAFCILGGIDDSAGMSLDPAAPTILIDGLIVLGGVEIRIKKRLRERLIAFAQSLRGI